MIHLKQAIPQDVLQAIQKYYGPLDHFHVFENGNHNTFNEWYSYGDQEPHRYHMRLRPSEVPLIDDAINAALQLTGLPLCGDGVINLLRYEVGADFPSHQDANGKFNGTQYTFVTLLNDEFEGGEFFIDGQDLPFEKGDVLVFPIDRWHGIKPVTNGSRYSLVVRTKKQ